MWPERVQKVMGPLKRRSSPAQRFNGDPRYQQLWSAETQRIGHDLLKEAQEQKFRKNHERRAEGGLGDQMQGYGGLGDSGHLAPKLEPLLQGRLSKWQWMLPPMAEGEGPVESCCWNASLSLIFQVTSWSWSPGRVTRKDPKKKNTWRPQTFLRMYPSVSQRWKKSINKTDDWPQSLQFTGWTLQ